MRQQPASGRHMCMHVSVSSPHTRAFVRAAAPPAPANLLTLDAKQALSVGSQAPPAAPPPVTALTAPLPPSRLTAVIMISTLQGVGERRGLRRVRGRVEGVSRMRVWRFLPHPLDRTAARHSPCSYCLCPAARLRRPRVSTATAASDHSALPHPATPHTHPHPT